MPNGRFIAYYRVSTEKQGRSGLGLEAQRKAVADYLHGGQWELLHEFTEVESGKRNDRPQLHHAIKAAKKAGATLIIAKLDRLARNVAFIANLMESGIEFVAADNPHASRLTLHVLAAVSEHERVMISERTKAALAAAKDRGTVLGGRRTADQYARSVATRSAVANQHAANVRPIISDIQRSGVVAYGGIAQALNARGIKTARGGAWHAESVRRVVLRTEG